MLARAWSVAPLRVSQSLSQVLGAAAVRRMAEDAPHQTAGGKAPPKLTWSQPEGSPVPPLKLYNSLTRKKELFVPLAGRRVLWYSCGPTVYDASHMGHARSYITFDILRRVLTDYFKYEVLYAMNITDIDDKIINRARRNHLFSEYKERATSLAGIAADVTQAIPPFRERAECEGDPDKKAMLGSTLRKVEEALVAMETDSAEARNQLLQVSRDPLSAWLDSKYGAEVKDHGIFQALTRHWEEEFHTDMEALNVLPPDILTRVSEFIPEVVSFVEKIIAQGYGYESNGSVYFDVPKFSASPDHSYAKLVPEAVGDLQALAEGEGELSVDKFSEKRSRNDFVLWKASKPGEPSWDSPWGRGRPGWHIECSVMACDALGPVADIHTGGVDLKFPHHDNEIAQAEACFGHDRWMSYFLHSGHLTIEGCKMSKSLKNFITIREALDRYSSRQLRLAFLLHSWGATLDYSDHTMKQAIHYERLCNEFFLTVKDLLRKLPCGVASYAKFGQREKTLCDKLLETKSAVHTALCDSVDTPQVMRHLRELIASANLYLAEVARPSLNVRLLQTIAGYVTAMLRVFGVVPSDASIGFPLEGEDSATNVEAVVMPFASALAEFREDVRKIALEGKNTPLLQQCDRLRDERLAELGVILEDKEGTSTVVKFVGREAAQRERQRAAEAQEEKVRVKEEQKRKLEEARRLKEAQAAIPPEEMFKDQRDKFSRFDEQGLPTHDASGEAITDSQRKKLHKQWTAQEKKHKEHLARNTAPNS